MAVRPDFLLPDWQNRRVLCLHAPVNCTLPLAGESSVNEVRVKWLATPTAMPLSKTVANTKTADELVADVSSLAAWEMAS
ncbi:hypothetical protein SV7mr_45700 [Stieleria bergensis]|uniref:Uncharacterized protein n=1 Tax=Stieleria bergensis TaxID=2528025 RepID=A0A517T0X4_9BACT|nr:hypothetical protein SV7mr_45700 [Planctomycetes bacterium SV_7m_r]